MADHVPIALQLYTVREQMAEDFEETVRHVAEIGYEGVEVAALPDSVTPAAAKSLFDALDLTVVGVHSPLPLDEDQETVLKTWAALDCPYLVCPWLDPDTYFRSRAGVWKACALLNEANVVVRQKAGGTLLYHNHWFEFTAVEGETAFEILNGCLDPTIGFEVDTYWVRTAGLDPVALLRDLGNRSPLLHIKDGPATMEAAMTAVGAGVMDVPRILEAASPEWLIVELDRCDTDMLTAVEESYAYLSKIGR
ncbi:MAG: sugar phosphate isomerase/epimerase family protein [Anaerolineae bacterium]